MTTPQDPPAEGQPIYAEPPVAGTPYPAEPPPAQFYQQPYPPQGYPPPAYGQQPPPYPYPYPYPPARSTNGMAIASMVLGILWLYWIGSILALIFGYVAKKQIDTSGGRQGGRGMATAGIVLGWVGVGFLSLVILIGVVGALA